MVTNELVATPATPNDLMSRFDIPETALVLEPREVYDACIVDVTASPEDLWADHRDGTTPVVVYSSSKLVDALMKHDEASREDALEHVVANIEGSWNGPATWAVRWDDGAD